MVMPSDCPLNISIGLGWSPPWSETLLSFGGHPLVQRSMTGQSVESKSSALNATPALTAHNQGTGTMAEEEGKNARAGG